MIDQGFAISEGGARVVTTRLTPAGWLAAVVIAGLLASCIWLEKPLGLTLAVALGLALVVAWMGAWWIAARLSAAWLLPHAPHAGDEATVGARIAAWRGLPPFQVWAWSPTTRCHEAVAAVIGGDDTRPRRVQWSMRFPRRGLVTMPPLGVEVTLPFGLVAARAAVSASATVMVLPRAGIVRRELRERLVRWLDDRAVIVMAGDEDFERLREYRAGDSPRRIHWPASARHRHLLVAERQEPVCRSIALVVDTAVPRDHARFERLIAVAATLVTHLHASGWTVSIHGAWLGRAGLHGDRQRLLEGLAMARIDTAPVLESCPAGRQAVVLAVSTLTTTGLYPEPLVLTLDECLNLVRLPRYQD